MQFDAVTFLANLFRPAAYRDATDLPTEWWEIWDERAAIMEYHGGCHRELAEAKALTEVLQLMEGEEAEQGVDI